jgi:hypothetical protein
LRLDSTNLTDFSQCTFTIRNVDADGSASGRKVAFVDVVSAGGFGGLFDSHPLNGDAPWISLNDCIARGQAPFVRADFAVAFSFSWEHGLFVSTDRLVEVGGTNYEPRWEHGRVNVYLKRLLSVADQGICLIRSDHVTPFQLGTFIKCDDCFFAVKPTTPQTPLFVVRAGSAFSQGVNPLRIEGNRNYYKNTQVVLRMETAGDRNAIEQYVFDDLNGPDSPSWYNEKNPEMARAAILSWDSPTQSVDRQTLYDFIPPSIGDGWFTLALGIAPSELPRLPDFSSIQLEPPAAKVTPAEGPTDKPAAELPDVDEVDLGSW